MGAAVNSEHDEIYFHVPKAGEYGYMTKELEEENPDIYRFEKEQLYLIVTVVGKVANSENQQPIVATVMVKKLPGGETIAQVKPDSQTGAYQFELEYGANYSYGIEVDGFYPISKNIDLREIGPTKEVQSDLLLTPVKKESIVLGNIIFNLNRAEMSGSNPELDRVIKLFDEKSIQGVEISGHTCDLGSEEYNLKLSERRAQAIKDYLTSAGADPDSIKVNSFGETSPLVPNTSEENRKKNRRVEIKILE